MTDQWLQRSATTAQWLFIGIAVLLVFVGPYFAGEIYSEGDSKHGAYDDWIIHITQMEQPGPWNNGHPSLTHEQANAARKVVNDLYKRDLWDLFSGPLIVLIVLAVIDIACRRTLKGRMSGSVLLDPAVQSEAKSKDHREPERITMSNIAASDLPFC